MKKINYEYSYFKIMTIFEVYSPGFFMKNKSLVFKEEWVLFVLSLSSTSVHHINREGPIFAQGRWVSSWLARKKEG